MKDARHADRSEGNGRLEGHGFSRIAEAARGEDVAARPNELRFGVVEMDPSLLEPQREKSIQPSDNGSPDVRVVVLTSLRDDPGLLRALGDEAQGYVLSEDAVDRVLALLRRAARSDTSRFAPRSERKRESSPDDLTERETEVLRLMVDGVTSNRRLADKLGVSENTVKFHVRNILDKLHLNSRAQAVGFALRTGLVEPSQVEPWPR